MNILNTIELKKEREHNQIPFFLVSDVKLQSAENLVERSITSENKKMLSKEQCQDSNQTQSQVRLHIKGIDVFFPRKPYPEQEEYMNTVIQTLKQKQNALLQSPSCSGKTLSLLCSTLGWQNFQRRQEMTDQTKWKNKIIYISKTNCQIKNVIKELKSTCYKPKVCIPAIREYYCMKKEFSHLKDSQLNLACRDALQNLSCQFYNYSGDQQKVLQIDQEDIHDIEDLKQLSQSSNCKFCPFYYSINNKIRADLLFLTHHQLLSQSGFHENQHLIQDSIIIFDDAHNLPQISECGKFGLFLIIRNNSYYSENSYKIDNKLIEEVEFEIQKQQNSLISFNKANLEEINQIKQVLLFFKDFINWCESDSKFKFGLPLKNGKKGRQGDLKELINFMEKNQNQFAQKVEIKRQQNQKNLVDDEEQQHLGSNQDFMSTIINQSPKLNNLALEMENSSLDQFCGFVGALCSIFQFNQHSSSSSAPVATAFQDQPDDSLSKFYKYYFQLENSDSQQLSSHQNLRNSYSSLSIICLDPNFALSKIIKLKPHSIILTSKTLHPINSWESELNIDFQQKLIISQISKDNQSKNIIGGLLQEGPNKIPINFSYSNLQNIQIVEELGEFLIDLAVTVPNGILVFFGSNSLMEKVHQIWKVSSSNMLQRISEVNNQYLQFKLISFFQFKHVFFEPTNPLELQQVIKLYQSKAQDDIKGAILFCACQGKISQINFYGKQSRNIVVVGIPFPSIIDIHVSSKIEYLDFQAKVKSSSDKQLISGKEWYFLKTIRNLNEILCKVTTYKKENDEDYSSIFLCDDRFSQSLYGEHYPEWLKPLLKVYPSYNNLIQEVRRFFDNKSASVTSLDAVLNLKKSPINISARNLFNNHNESSSNFPFLPYKIASDSKRIPKARRQEDSYQKFESIYNQMKKQPYQQSGEITEQKDAMLIEQEEEEKKQKNRQQNEKVDQFNSQLSPSQIDSFPIKKRKIVISQSSNNDFLNNNREIVDHSFNQQSTLLADNSNDGTQSNHIIPFLKLKKSDSKEGQQIKVQDNSKKNEFIKNLNQESSLDFKRTKSLKILETSQEKSKQSCASFSEVLKVKASSIEMTKQDHLIVSKPRSLDQLESIIIKKPLKQQQENDETLKNNEQTPLHEDNQQNQFHSLMSNSNICSQLSSLNKFSCINDDKNASKQAAFESNNEKSFEHLKQINNFTPIEKVNSIISSTKIIVVQSVIEFLKIITSTLVVVIKHAWLAGKIGQKNNQLVLYAE